MQVGFMIEADIGARGTPDGCRRPWTEPGLLRCTSVSGALQPAVGVNNASCNGRVKVSESVRTSLYMYSEVGKPVVNSDFNELSRQLLFQIFIDFTRNECLADHKSKQKASSICEDS